jgi:hypothetical protein
MVLLYVVIVVRGIKMKKLTDKQILKNLKLETEKKEKYYNPRVKISLGYIAALWLISIALPSSFSSSMFGLIYVLIWVIGSFYCLIQSCYLLYYSEKKALGWTGVIISGCIIFLFSLGFIAGMVVALI